MGVLDTIDTTVTFEWGSTRTIGTLIQLGGYKAVITTLRAPPVGHAVHLRLEGEDAIDAIAVDGACAALADSDWGEHQVTVQIQRVGATSSATALRDFIEQHDIERGGSVSIGKNRDNPELKRFVYTLPARPIRDTAPFELSPTDDDFAASSANFSEDTPTVAHAPIDTPIHEAPRGPSASAGLQLKAPPPRQPQPLDDDEQATKMLNILGAFEPEAPLERTAFMNAVQPAANPRIAPVEKPAAVEKPAVVAQPAPVAVAITGQFLSEPPLEATALLQAFDDDAVDVNEPILVNTVSRDINVASPVITAPKAGHKPQETGASLVKRLFGGMRGKNAGGTAAPALAAEAEIPGSLASAAADAGAAGAARVAQAQQAHAEPQRRLSATVEPSKRGSKVSGSLEAVQALFARDTAVRADRPVQFEFNRKKYKGVLQRLAETKLRIQTAHMPELYDRVLVYLPAPQGQKDPIALQCVVARMRPPDNDSSDGSFDAQINASNPPLTMARLRLVLVELETPPPRD